MELATLKLVVDANGAVQSVERLNTSLDKNVKVAKMSEAAALANGRSWVTIARGTEQATRATTALNSTIGVTTRQMSGAAQKSLLLADALSRGSVSGATLSARLLGLGQTAGLVFGPAGIAFAAVAGFTSMFVSRMEAAKMATDEAKKSLLELARAMDTAPAMARMAELHLGQRGLNGRLQGGIPALEADIARLQRENASHTGTSMGGGTVITNSREYHRTLAELRATEAALASAKDEMKQLQELVMNWQAMPKLGPLDAVTINASRDAVVNLTGAILAARSAWEHDPRNRNSGLARSVPGQPSTGDPLAPIGIGGGISPHPFWRGIGKGDGPQADAFTEAFAENFSRAMGDAIGSAFSGGLRSGRAFADTISNAIGQAISGRVSKGIAGKLGDVSTGDLLGVGSVLTVLNMFAGSVREHSLATRALQEATANLRSSVSQSRDNVQQWVASATASPDQQAMMGNQATAAGFVNDIFSQFGARSAAGSNNRYRYDTVRSSFGTIDFDEIESFLHTFRSFASAEDLQRIQEVLDAYQSVIAAQQRSAQLSAANALGEYRNSLSLSQFSPLSPTAQLKEARAEFERLRGLAMGGDTTAANQLAGASNTLLGLSRSVNASGGRYVADFNSTRDALRIVEEAMRARATREEESVIISGRIANATERANEIAADGYLRLEAAILTMTAEIEELKRITKEPVT